MTTVDLVDWRLEAYGDPVRFGSGAWRRAISSAGPLPFALTYLAHHLRSDQTGGRITLSQVHRTWNAQALDLAAPGRPSFRRANIAPREMGKSTWKFLIVPMWAAAHGYTDFIAAFGDTAGVAQQHLATFTHELQTNALLRVDFPDLCAPLVRDRGRTSADRVDLYRATSGFAFAARGMETQALGLKIAERRPDFILLDDIEPAEEQYSAEQVGKRLATLQDTILPLNDQARVELVGTVTRVDSIIHQLVKVARGQIAADAQGTSWVADDGWEPHYHAPIVEDTETNAEASVWPERWPIEHLQRIRHTRSYLKNFANDPAGADGDYWTVNDFQRTRLLEGSTRTLLSVDPAVTTKQSSDFTGLAVVEWAPDPTGRTSGRCRVKRALRVKLSGADLRLRLLDLLGADEVIRMVLVETNQGGDVWKQILHSLPVPVRTVHQTVKKEVRAATVLNLYQLGRVEHALVGMSDLENEQTGFPRAPHDDLVDAAGTGVAYFLAREPRKSAGVAMQASYV